MTKGRRWTPLVAICAALLLAACGEQGSVTGVTDTPGSDFAVDLTPLDGDDGLTERDLTGISGTDFVTAGTGTTSNGAETITVEVPSGATVTQVYLYWTRRVDDPGNAPDSEVLVDGSTVTGSVVGGPIATSDDRDSPVAYLADITGEGLVGPGSSSFTVQDDTPGESSSLDSRPLGASVLVFFDDGGDASETSLWDGVDFAWGVDSEPEWRQTADPVTFAFSSSDQERTARLTLFVGDVEGSGRPNELDITVGGTTETLDQPFFAADGQQWDNFVREITIPAGVGEVTVEPVSPLDEDNPSSLVWAAAGLSVEAVETGGGEGCTPGYWKQPQHEDSWEGHAPENLLGSVFTLPADLELENPENADPDELTLLEGLELRGGGVNALIRHSVAALLNAANGDVSYDLTEAEVIEAFDDAVAGGDVEGTKDELEGFNEQGCPLD